MRVGSAAGANARAPTHSDAPRPSGQPLSAGSGFECGSQAQDNAIAAAITACEDAREKRGLQVVVTGSLDNETGQGVSCSPLTLGVTTDEGARVIVTNRGLFAKGTLSHELGHALGIKGHSADQDNLMYKSEIPSSPRLLSPEDCGIARERAAGLQATVW